VAHNDFLCALSILSLCIACLLLFSGLQIFDIAYLIIVFQHSKSNCRKKRFIYIMCQTKMFFPPVSNCRDVWWFICFIHFSHYL